MTRKKIVISDNFYKIQKVFKKSISYPTWSAFEVEIDKGEQWLLLW